jgi:hypothetical protein
VGENPRKTKYKQNREMKEGETRTRLSKFKVIVYLKKKEEKSCATTMSRFLSGG